MNSDINGGFKLLRLVDIWELGCARLLTDDWNSIWVLLSDLL